MTNKQIFRGLSGSICLALLLTACGGGNDGGNQPPPVDKTQEVSGAVAVGAAVSGAIISAKCASGSTVSGIISNADGSYTLEVSEDDFPCVLKATGGNLPAGTSALHSYASSSTGATVNITPLTDLALAMAVKAADGKDLADWFAAPANWTSVSDGLSAALTSLREDLGDAGYDIPSSWADPMAPVSLAFVPSATPASDTLDKLLEDIQDAFADAGTSYDDVLKSIVGGGSFPEADPTDPTDPPEPPVQQGAVGNANFGDDSGPTQAEFLTLMSQTWPVAIYEVPDSNPDWYGQGSLTISGSTSNWTMELRGADGSVISSLEADGALTKALKAFSEVNYGLGPIYMPGQIFINKGVDVDEYLNAYIEWDTGLIEGNAGGNAEVKFRNSVTAYGSGVPEIFSDLAGTWTAPYENWCVSPPTTGTNTLTITAAGEVTLVSGGAQDCKTEFPLSFSWGGKDDFLIPDPEESDGSFIMHLDAQNFSNVSGGRVQIRFNSDMSVRKISASTPSLFEMKKPVKE